MTIESFKDLHERIRENYIRDDSRDEYEAAAHTSDIAGWWICQRCGHAYRYNPDYPNTVRRLVEHEHECADDLPETEMNKE